MELSIDSQNTIRKYIKDKRFNTTSNEIILSLQDSAVLILFLQDAFNKFKDVDIIKTITEIRDKRYEERIKTINEKI